MKSPIASSDGIGPQDDPGSLYNPSSTEECSKDVSHGEKVDPSSTSTQSTPIASSNRVLPEPKVECLPVEIFQRVLSFLPHEDRQNVRLVCRAFEWNAAGIVFAKIVLPFRPLTPTHIYERMSLAKLLAEEEKLRGREVSPSLFVDGAPCSEGPGEEIGFAASFFHRFGQHMNNARWPLKLKNVCHLSLLRYGTQSFKVGFRCLYAIANTSAQRTSATYQKRS